MTDTITEVDMDLVKRTALRAIHPRATLASRLGRDAVGTLFPPAVVYPAYQGDYDHVLVLDEGESHADFFAQGGDGTVPLWQGARARWVHRREVQVHPLTAEQIIERLPRYTDNDQTSAAIPPGTLGDVGYSGSMTLAVMLGGGQPYTGWEMDAHGSVELTGTFPLASRTGLWGWWLTSTTGIWTLPGDSTEPSFEEGERLSVDQIGPIRGLLFRRSNDAELWVSHGDGTATQIQGRIPREPQRLGLGTRMPGTDDPDNCWVRDGWTYVGYDPSRVPGTPEVEPEGNRLDDADEDEVTTLRRRLEEAEQRYTQDLNTISEILGEEAVERDWCGEYEQVVNKINRSISGELQPCRDQEASVSVTVRGYARIPWTVDINVPVECRNGDPSTDQVREAVGQWLNDSYVEHAAPMLDESRVEYESTYSVSEVEIDDEWEVN